MDFLKSAVASAISKGPPFPYIFGDRADVDNSLWTLYNGTRREDGSNCSIFAFDVAANKTRLPLARNAVRKLRTLRHPGLIRVLDTVETETYIYIATERVTPLSWHIRRKSLGPETLKWGLFNTARTIKFINDEASSVHGNIRTSSIFCSESGEWKIGGCETLSSMKDEEAVIYTYGSFLPDSGRYAPPEIGKSGWDVIKRGPVPAVDAYTFGIMVYEVFNGSFVGSDQLLQAKNIPPSIQQSYKRLINSSPRARLSVGHFLEQGQRNGGFFDTPLIRLTDGIDNIGLQNEEERTTFLSELEQVSDDVPGDFLKLKILPELLKALEFGGGGPQIFSIVMKFAAQLSEEEFESRMIPVVVRLFASQDRALRVCLLDNLPLMIDRLPQKIVNDKIFPQMVTGFSDVSPVVREQTVKAVLTVVNKLSDRTVNGELLRHLAKTANDEQPGIRTNTTICLGKIARNLGAGTRQKVLTAAFARALRDPFVHARNAALMALAATSDVFTDDDCATKLLPAICPSLVDKDKMVRDQTNKTMDLYLQRIRKYAASLPDSFPPPSGATTVGGNVPRMSTPQNDNSWTGWAISSFTNKLTAVSGDMNSGGHAASKEIRSGSMPPSIDSTRPSAHKVQASALPRSGLVASPPAGPTSAPLSAASSTSNLFDTTPGGEEDDMDAWGDMVDDPWEEEKPPGLSERPTRPDAPTKGASAKFDDGGEPDFAGWLAAQSQAKPKAPLPKGLTKTTNGAQARVPMAKSKLSVRADNGLGRVTKAAPKQINTKPKEEEDDGWGEAWE